MDSQENITVDPLFAGLTRPPSVRGIPYDALIFCGMTTAIAFLGTGSVLALLVILPLVGISFLATKNEPRQFTLIFLWLKHQSYCRNRGYWKVNSYSPLENKPNVW